MTTHIHLCATGKSGLGHIRRLTNWSTELKKCSPLVQLHLLSNAPLACLTQEEEKLFNSVSILPRESMGKHLKSRNPDAVIVDTAIIPDLDKVNAYLGLLLRQTIDAKLSHFALANQRPWDRIYVPKSRTRMATEYKLSADTISRVCWLDFSSPSTKL